MRIKIYNVWLRLEWCYYDYYHYYYEKAGDLSDA